MTIFNLTRRKDDELLQEIMTSSFDFGKIIVGFINHKNFQIISIEYATNQMFMEILDFYVPLTIIFGSQKSNECLEFENFKISKVLNEIIVSTKKNVKIVRIELKQIPNIINFGCHFIYTAISRKYPFNTDTNRGHELLMKSINFLNQITPCEDFGKGVFCLLKKLFVQ